MGTSRFSGPVVSTAGFTGPITATTAAATTSLTVGSGTAITKIVKGTVAVDPSSLTTNTGEILEFVCAAAAVGDAVILHPPAAGIDAGIMVGQAYVSEAGKIKVQLWNLTAGTVNVASANWIYTLIRS